MGTTLATLFLAPAIVTTKIFTDWKLNVQEHFSFYIQQYFLNLREFFWTYFNLALLLGFSFLIIIIIFLFLEGGGMFESIERSREKKEQKNFEKEKANDIEQRIIKSQENVSENEKKFLEYYYRNQKKEKIKRVILLIIFITPFLPIFLIPFIITFFR